MKLKTPTEFLTFSDGTCEIWSVSRNTLHEKIKSTRFGDRSISLSRFIEASQMASAQIEKVIHIHLCRDIAQAHRVVIDSVQYKIERAQHLRETNPPVTVLYLSKIGEVPRV